LSNYLDLKPIADQFGIDYYHIPHQKTPKPSKNSNNSELLQHHKINFTDIGMAVLSAFIEKSRHQHQITFIPRVSAGANP
jgi:formyltetrahydrofolate deformylase